MVDLSSTIVVGLVMISTCVCVDLHFSHTVWVGIGTIACDMVHSLLVFFCFLLAESIDRTLAIPLDLDTHGDKSNLLHLLNAS